MGFESVVLGEGPVDDETGGSDWVGVAMKCPTGYGTQLARTSRGPDTCAVCQSSASILILKA
jgi:hypothetical protein